MNSRRIGWLICVLLAVLTLAAYWRVLGCGFLNYDDEVYVTKNHWVQAGLALSSIKWALTGSCASNWHPLTMLSHMLDYQLYGIHPLGHHLTSLVFHILSAMLLFLLIRRMTGSTWRSAFVAALFAVHPLHVESVAWVAERKDVLSTFLLMLTLHAYVSHVRRPGKGWYVVTLGLFTLGLMAKPMLVSVPFILLLLDCWPLGRFTQGKAKADRMASVRRLAWEKLPFFVLSASSCVVTFIVQRKGESVVSTETATIGMRIANALVSYVAYLSKMVWPQKLAVIYPHPFGAIPTWQVIGSAVLLVAVTVLVLRAARTRPYLAVGWFWYVITLVPVIGLVQVGQQAMADRYTYIPLIGVFVALAWGCTSTSRSRSRSMSGGPVHPRTLMLCLPALVVVAACTAGTWHQTGYWKNSATLFQHAIDATGRNYVAEINLGLALSNEGRYKDAITHLKASVDIRPSAKAYGGIGSALLHMDKPDEAVSYYEKSIALDPKYAPSHGNLGFVLLDLGKIDEAAGRFRRTLQLDPDQSGPHCGLATVYTAKGRINDAIREYNEAIRIDPENAPAYAELGNLLQGQGKTDKAVECLETALSIAPDAGLHYKVGSILAGQQKLDSAIEHFRAAIRLEPNYSRAHYDLAVALCAQGKIDEGIEHYSQAVKIAPNYAAAHEKLAIAFYFRGDCARSWKEIRLAQKYGTRVDPEFIKALSEKTAGSEQ